MEEKTNKKGPREPRHLSEILDGLAKPVPGRMLNTKRMGGQEITFIPWYRAQKIFSHYTNGFWEYRIVDRWQNGGDFMITVEITIHTKDGAFSRQGTGREEPGVTGFGDTQSNAESMAFRRACAKWHLGIDLYEGKR